MSAESVTLILPTLCVPGVGYLWPPSSCYCLERVFGRPVLLMPNLTFHIDVACARLHCSIPATWPLQFHLILWATATVSFVLVVFPVSPFVTLSLHTTCSFAAFSAPSSANKTGASLSFSLSEDAWASRSRTRNTPNSMTSLSTSKIFRPRHLTFSKPFHISFLLCSRVIPAWYPLFNLRVFWDMFKSFCI